LVSWNDKFLEISPVTVLNWVQEAGENLPIKIPVMELDEI